MPVTIKTEKDYQNRETSDIIKLLTEEEDDSDLSHTSVGLANTNSEFEPNDIFRLN